MEDALQNVTILIPSVPDSVNLDAIALLKPTSGMDLHVLLLSCVRLKEVKKKFFFGCPLCYYTFCYAVRIPYHANVELCFECKYSRNWI